MAPGADQVVKAVVVAAGRGSRFGGTEPKQFLDLGGRSVLEHAVRAMCAHPRVSGAVVVLAPDRVGGDWEAKARSWDGVLSVAAGGATRGESVARGLDAAGAADYVLVHDAARPRVSAELIDVVIRATLEHGAAIPVLPIRDTVKRCRDGRVIGTVEREELGLAQTPQGFRVDWLAAALPHDDARTWLHTDEASALEAGGKRVATVEGDPNNQKITTEADLNEMRRKLSPPDTDLRVGFGFDVHRFSETPRPLYLGGVRFDGETGLAGHSDADVVLHAAMDAALGAAALGDIGVHFPPDDPTWAEARSTDLARRVERLLAARGHQIVNLDLMLLAEAPRIRSRVDAMRETIARCFALSIGRVGLKATTLERLGALGRGEGIACQAVALVRASAE